MRSGYCVIKLNVSDLPCYDRGLDRGLPLLVHGLPPLAWASQKPDDAAKYTRRLALDKAAGTGQRGLD